MEKKIYIGLLDAGQKKQEAVVQRTETYTDHTTTVQYSGLANRADNISGYPGMHRCF